MNNPLSSTSFSKCKGLNIMIQRKPNIKAIQETLEIPHFQPLTESNYCKLKKRIKEANTIGYVYRYFENNFETWIDVEFEHEGWLFCSDLVEAYSIKTILKNRALDGLKSFKKNTLFYMDNDRIELVPTKADPKSDEDMVLTIYFSESYYN